MAALNTLTREQRIVLANALTNAGKLVFNEVQRSPVSNQANATAVLAATKTLLDGAQG